MTLLDGSCSYLVENIKNTLASKTFSLYARLNKLKFP